MIVLREERDDTLTAALERPCKAVFRPLLIF